MKTILVVLCFLFLANSAWAVTYTIGPGQTYTTFTALVATETLAADDIVDGGGNTFTENWTVDGSGTDGHPIILRNAIVEGNVNGNIRNYLRITRMTVLGQIIISGNNCQVDYSKVLVAETACISVTGTGNTIYNTIMAGCGQYGLSTTQDLTIKNSIFRSNVIGDITIASGKTVIGQYNITQWGGTDGNGSYTDTGTLWSTDPLWVNQGGLDFRLKNGSPAINAGVAIAGLTTDFVGAAVLQGNLPDIGAYEHYPYHFLSGGIMSGGVGGID